MSLFEPFQISSHKIKNRIVVLPVLESVAERDGKVSHEIFEYTLNLAQQGAGTIILNSAYVSPQGKSDSMQLSLAHEEVLPMLASLVKHLKKSNTFVGIRLSHAGAKTSEKICGEQPIGPANLHFGKDFDTSRAFTEDDVDELCLSYSHAIERAEEVGLDFVEINGAQQQLFDQCLNSRHNQRTDKYGGKIENRLALACKVIRAMKKRVHNRLLISYFFSIHDKLEDDFTPKDLQTMIRQLEKAGVDIFHPVTIHVMNKFFNSEATLLEWVSKCTKKPVFVEGNIKSTSVLKEVLTLGKATAYGLDKGLFTRLNWYQFLQKKIVG